MTGHLRCRRAEQSCQGSTLRNDVFRDGTGDSGASDDGDARHAAKVLTIFAAMIQSMTGYGKAEVSIDGTPTTFEVRSVNGRYLELSIRTPREWADREGDIREIVKQQVARGSVNVFVRRESGDAEAAITIDHPLAKAYVEALHELKDTYKLDGSVSVDHLANYAAIFQGERESADDDAVTEAIKQGMQGALDALNAMRAREGDEMKADMVSRLTAIDEHLGTVETLSTDRIPEERKRLREKVTQLMEDEAIDEQRLQLEITLLADRLDISEEIVRLRSHMKHFRSDLDEGGVVGRKLNFQLQEMNREVNTMGSKANDATIGRHVVSMKEELERMREQVQNIE